ncbi:6-carboxyhexanoate--CoA ligase [Fibrobacter sp. UWB1]|uniref:6-carboxyhexanoate--CoA ligase n=1 Tax=Fibrobacter sp. UWB1 TaxID=1964355 RepID=UPI000B523AD2|nr:6-carboxyhexanoate--CoA ligase [Fibrobacter sp. UWB1]OWV25534.1 6-carboxyhexanoate--CoA ligase [Fibrobacter sp. UWB1]
MEYYSLKMRASQQVGEGEQKREQHISGAERIVNRDSVEAVCTAMVRRAMTHSKGDPDFINVKIEKVHENDIQVLKALPVTRIDVETWQEGLEKAFGVVGDAATGIREKLPELLHETFPMRGAMLYDIATGERLEPDHERGVRATYMDALHSSEVDGCKNHFNEAIVLATKVANAPGMVAEFCVSDDPNYVTGYVASKELGYVRIMKMKEMGDENGGRIFLFDSRKAKAEECIEYLQKKKVLVEIADRT